MASPTTAAAAASEAVSELAFAVGGMDCAACAQRVEKWLLSQPGVASARVNLFAGSATCTVTEASSEVEDALLAGIQRLGFTAAPASASAGVLHIEVSAAAGRAGPGALAAVVASLTALPGVTKTEAEAAPAGMGKALGSIVLAYDASAVGARDLLASDAWAAAAAAAGVSLAVVPPGNAVDVDADAARVMVRRLLVSSACATAAAVIAYAVPAADGSEGQGGTGIDMPLGGNALATPRQLAQLALASITFMYAGWPLAVAAWRAARYSRELTMDTLVVTAAAAAWLYSVGLLLAAGAGRPEALLAEPAFEATTILLALVFLGRWLEYRAKRRTAAALRELAALQRTDALVVAGKATAEATPAGLAALPGEPVPSHLLQLGDIVRVGPGCRVPADGDIVDGTSGVDESALTGEARPVLRAVGDLVIGGSTAVDGTLHVRVSALPGAGAVSRLAAALQEAQALRPPSSLLADRVASAFTPAIFVLSLAVYFAWYCAASYGVVDTSGAPPATFALVYALSLLVVSCPCAISLAAPTAVVVAVSVAARRLGALVKGGPAMEALANVRHVVFDKTGTLTLGRPELFAVKLLAADGVVVAAAKALGVAVKSIVPPPGSAGLPLSTAQGAALAAAAAVEVGSTHPLAVALMQAAAARVALKPLPAAPVAPPKASSCPVAAAAAAAAAGPVRTSIAGGGVRAKLGSGSGRLTSVLLGSLDFLRRELTAPLGSESGDEAMPRNMTEVEGWEDAEEAAAELGAAGCSVVALAVEGVVIAAFGLADTPRPEAAAVIARLAATGVSCWIASGDNAGAVAAAARAVGMLPARAHGELSPAGKAAWVDRIRREGAAAQQPGLPDAAPVCEPGAAFVDAVSVSVATAQGSSKGGALPDERARSALPSAAAAVACCRRRRRSSSSSRAPGRLGAVAFIGDGINDAPALAAADVGIAVSADAGKGSGSGSSGGGMLQIAMDCADIVLLGLDGAGGGTIEHAAVASAGAATGLLRLPLLIELSAATRRAIRRNFVWAFLYNLIAMPLAGGVLYPVLGSGGVIPPGVAGVSELLSSVPVVAFSLLLYRWRPQLGGRHRS